MNSIRQRRGLTLIVGAVALAISPALGNLARAVTITGNTYASQTGGSPPASAANSYNMTNLTSVSANIQSNTTVSHAQSYASASVGAMGVTKTTGGRAWTDSPTNTFNARGDLWNASATGTTIVAQYNGSQPAPPAQFQFSLPASILQKDDPFYSVPVSPSGPAGPTSMLLPTSTDGMGNPTVAQGAIVNAVAGTPNPSFFDIFADVEASIPAQGSIPFTPLFSGTFMFDPSTGELTTTGGFANQITVTQQPGGSATDPTQPEYSLTFAQNIMGGTFNATANSPFSVSMTSYMTMGNPDTSGNPATFQPFQFPQPPIDNPDQFLFPNDFGFAPFDFTNSSTPPQGVIGGGGSITAQFLLSGPNQADFSVSAVPEPSTFCLAAIAGVALLWQRRRRRS